MINKIKILFVETGRPSSMNNFGGSVYSIIQLIQSLDKIKYKTFYYSKYHMPKAYKILEDIGVTVLSNKDNSKIKKKNHKKLFSKYTQEKYFI